MAGQIRSVYFEDKETSHVYFTLKLPGSFPSTTMHISGLSPPNGPHSTEPKHMNYKNALTVAIVAIVLNLLKRSLLCNSVHMCLLPNPGILTNYMYMHANAAITIVHMKLPITSPSHTHTHTRTAAPLSHIFNM